MLRTPMTLAVVLSTCSTEPMAPVDAGACAVNASQVCYSNQTSGLTSTNVQAAIDELNTKVQTRPAIDVESALATSPHDGRADTTLIVSCPDQVHEIPLNCSCRGFSTSTLYVSSVLMSASTAACECDWHEPGGQTGPDPYRASVVCLKNAR
jgi:hypothetical protein